MSRVVYLILGLVILQTIAAKDLVKQAEELLTNNPFRVKRDDQAAAVKQAELLLTAARHARSANMGRIYHSRYESEKNAVKRASRSPQRTLYSQPGAEPMQIKIMSLD